MQFWVTENRGVPAAVLAIGDDGLPRRYVPGMGLVDWPSLVELFMDGDVHAVTPAEARSLIIRGVGKLDPAVVARNKGDAPTLPVSL